MKDNKEGLLNIAVNEMTANGMKNAEHLREILAFFYDAGYNQCNRDWDEDIVNQYPQLSGISDLTITLKK